MGREKEGKVVVRGKAEEGALGLENGHLSFAFQLRYANEAGCSAYLLTPAEEEEEGRGRMPGKVQQLPVECLSMVQAPMVRARLCFLGSYWTLS
jgi:hypothetical protein